MHMFRIWGLLYVLSSAGLSLCVNEIEYDDGFADSYDNGISVDQQQEDLPNTQYYPDFSYWDKLFITLEDSHMRQVMLQESGKQCCRGIVSLRSQLDKLLRGASQQSAPSLVSACRAQIEQEAFKLESILAELQQDGAEMEKRINATLQTILQSRQEDSARLSRLEEAVSNNQTTQRPGGLSRTFNLGVEVFPSEQEMPELSSQVNLNMIKRSLVDTARDVQKVYQQLSRVIEQAGTLTKGRGDT